MSRNKNVLGFVTYGTAIFLCISILVCVAHLWDADFSVPLNFEGDALFYHALVKGIIENGWVLHNRYIGMPTGFDLHDVPLTDNLNFGLIKLISYFAPSSAVTLNIFAFLTFPLITITSLFVFRYLNLSRTIFNSRQLALRFSSVSLSEAGGPYPLVSVLCGPPGDIGHIVGILRRTDLLSLSTR